MTSTTRNAHAELSLDPIRCDGRGVCHELLPELIELDEWGYPVFLTGGLGTAVPEELMEHAQRAVESCPVLALKLTRTRK